MRWGVLILALASACGRTPLVVESRDAAGTDAAWVPTTDLRVTAGLGFVCASRRGEAWCWGANECGELGACLSPFDPPRTTPVQVELDEPVIQLDAGWHACAVVESGRVFCWGNGTSGQIGDGRTGCHRCPREVDEIRATHVSAGVVSSCAVLGDGDVACWGSNADGRIGEDSHSDFLTPHRVGVSNALTVAQDDRHTCVVHDDGSVSCWGMNRGGALGVGVVGHIAGVVRPSVGGAEQVDVGGQRSCIRGDGRLHCWGTGEVGNMGIGEQDVLALSPVTLPIDRVSWFDVTSSTGCAVSHGNVLCWGENHFGELGDGTMRMRTRPHRIEGLENMIGVTISERVGCAWNAAEEIYCWGGNANGEVGNGTTEPSYTPTRVLTPW